MYLLGIDLGSSFVKASIVDADSGRSVSSASAPGREMSIASARPGWAEQEPDQWWSYCCEAVRAALASGAVAGADVAAIGISYQMHGLVLVDKAGNAVRPAIIWCDGRAVDIGKKAFSDIGAETCLGQMLNSPGNFTASKLKWVLDNEPASVRRSAAFLLPGDFLALRMTGRAATTVPGLSEGILWDFSRHAPASVLLDHYGIPESLIPEIVPTFGAQGALTAGAAGALGLKAGIPVTYRAGDQPNNAFSLKVLEPGEVAATAGTSGVMYGVTSEVRVDTGSRVNTFAHVNHTRENKRLGVLLCVNGAGIANAWHKRLLGETMSYDEMNRLACSVPVGSDGVCVLPFGNGAERMLGNADIGASIAGLRFNRHTKAHLCRAVQEGVAFALKYGMDIMENLGVAASRIRAGRSNMFLSKLFGETVAGVANVAVELYNTDGAQGAARGAGIGCGMYPDAATALKGLRIEETIEPDTSNSGRYTEAYARWREVLDRSRH